MGNVRSHPHMPYPRAPLDGRRVQPVDLQLLADLFQHAELDLGVAAVGGDHVAGQGIGGLVEALGQSLADQAEEGVEAVFLFEEVEHGSGDAADAVGVVGGEDRHVVDHAGDGHQLGRADVLVGGGTGDHDGDQRVLRGHGGGVGHLRPHKGFRGRLLTGGRGGNRGRAPEWSGVSGEMT